MEGQENEKKGTNPKIIVSIIIALFLFLMVCCAGGYFILMSSNSMDPEVAKAETQLILNTNLHLLCQKHQDLDSTTISIYFLPEYIDAVSVAETKGFLNEMFPVGFDCATLNTGQPDTVLRETTVNSVIDTGDKQAFITMETEEGKFFTITLYDRGNGWKIYEVSKEIAVF